MLGLDIRENAYKLNTGGTRYCQTLFHQGHLDC